MKTRLLSGGTCVCGKTIVSERLAGFQFSFKFTERIKRNGAIKNNDLCKTVNQAVRSLFFLYFYFTNLSIMRSKYSALHESINSSPLNAI